MAAVRSVIGQAIVRHAPSRKRNGGRDRRVPRGLWVIVAIVQAINRLDPDRAAIAAITAIGAAEFDEFLAPERNAAAAAAARADIDFAEVKKFHRLGAFIEVASGDTGSERIPQAQGFCPGLAIAHCVKFRNRRFIG